MVLAMAESFCCAMKFNWYVINYSRTWLMTWHMFGIDSKALRIRRRAEFFFLKHSSRVQVAFESVFAFFFFLIFNASFSFSFLMVIRRCHTNSPSTTNLRASVPDEQENFSYDIWWQFEGLYSKNGHIHGNMTIMTSLFFSLSKW